MSILRAAKAWLGLSNTPANNFTFRAPDDGTLRISRGNAGAEIHDVLTISASGKPAFPQALRTWQNVTGSRVAGTTYTNNTGQPIHVAVTGIVVLNGSVTLTVDGVLVGRIGANVGGGTPNVNLNAQIYAEVPAGSTYVVATSGASISVWAELS